MSFSTKKADQFVRSLCRKYPEIPEGDIYARLHDFGLYPMLDLKENLKKLRADVKGEISTAHAELKRLKKANKEKDLSAQIYGVKMIIKSTELFYIQLNKLLENSNGDS